MEKYYSFGWMDQNKKSGIAYAPDDTPLAHELVEEMENVNELPFTMTLKNGEQQDFLANSLAWPLMSERLKLIIDKNLSGKEGIEWVKAKVKTPNGLLDYYVPKFKKKLDVLDTAKTKYVSGTDHIIKPVFSIDKIKEYHLFHKPTMSWRISANLYVSEDLKNELQKQNLTGINFEKVSVA